jgi:hypothetical protein
MSGETVTAGERLNGATVVGVLRYTVYTLAALLALSLLAVGTIAIIAEIKGTWHWAIHLQSTVSYVGLFISYLLYALVPLFGLLLVSRWWFDDA